MRYDYNLRQADSLRLLRYPEGRVAYAVLAVSLLAAPWLLPPFFVGEMSFVFIMAIASLGLMLLTGFTGQVSLGHSAFLAIGAYTHVRLLMLGVPLPLSILGAAALCALVGLVTGIPAIRVHGLYLAMVTLAMAMLVEFVIGRWDSVTGGFTGIAVPEPQLLGVSFGNLRGFYFLCLTVLVVLVLLLVQLLRGATGRAFVGVRDSEAAAASLGLWVAGYKVFAFVISAALCGIAGALLAHQVQYLTPEAFSLMLSLQLVLMVVIGGLGSLRGAILGAALISLLPTAISALKDHLPSSIGKQTGLDLFIFGLILGLFVLLEPTGINGRWLRIKRFLGVFPLVHPMPSRRIKRYMKSERYR